MKKIILFSVLMVYTIFICSCSQNEINSTQKHKENIIKDNDTISKCKLEQSIISDNGCSLIEKKEKVDLDVAEDLDISIELLRKEECYEIKFYSPDHKNYILAAIEEIDEEENIIYKIYLNNREIFLSSTDYNEFDNNSIKWLDNENVLITGEYSYNIRLNHKSIMDFSIPNQSNDSNEYYMKNYSINYLKDKIAYVFIKNRNEYIYIYDMKSKKWQHIWNEYKLIDYYGFDALWDKNDNLYFDSWGIILDKNNMVIEPREIYIEIYKYNDNTQCVNLLINDYNLHSASLDYENILIENCENYFPDYYVYNFNEQKIIHSFQENFIDGKICWANNSKYIAYYDKDLKTIYIYSILSNKTYEQNINHIIGNSYLTEITAEDDYFIFFIGRYDSGYTYSIKIKNLNEIQ